MLHLKLRNKNNPGRHVINSIKCHTSKISHFFDHHLQPLVKEISSHIKDTNDFVNKIDNFKVPENSSLVKMNVKTLYTNIPNNEGVAAVKRKRSNYTEKNLRSENKLTSFINEINKKHHSIKFDFKFSIKKIEFLDTFFHKDHNNRLQTMLYKKPIHRQNHLHAKSAHPLSQKRESIRYSQSLRIKCVCSAFDEYKRHSNDLVKRFVEEVYRENKIRNQIKKVGNLER